MQVIRYAWKDWKPVFVTSAGGTMRLFEEELRFVAGRKRCTGYSRNGKRIECPESAEAGESKCGNCMLRDNFFMCIKCTGNECLNPARREECRKEKYFIYLSAFDSLLKVGISQSYRLRERLVEQGADFAAKIAEVQDGKTVRLVEQGIASALGITDRVGGAEKQKRIFGDPNASVKQLLSAISQLQNSGFNEYLINPEIYDLREYYRLGNVLSSPTPIAVKEGTEISGKVTAAKGNILILENEGAFLSLNAHDIIGRTMEGI
ncbi:MAG: DUF2797 domain-containing protein [Candidatus Aenigmarchaeota archaeon]|nr:DUF2797 domain-containing protein [Candidatus Aenigmarchaeota archaeon]